MITPPTSLIGALLEEQVQNILPGSSAEHAIREARQQSLDVILMDIQMPDIDGIRASEIIRSMPHHASTPIVAVTAHAIDGEREQLIKAGMNDYLAKPIDESKLRQLLARYTPPPVVTVPELLPILPTLDWQLALRQAANKADLARDLLRMLLEFYRKCMRRWRSLCRPMRSTPCVRLFTSCTAVPATAACRA